jgi:hypothetical protein
MVTERQRYLAYMLRLWQVGDDKTVWRASLENAHTGSRQSFASLDTLFVFLEAETDQGSSATARGSCLESGESQGQESAPYSGGLDDAMNGLL